MTAVNLIAESPRGVEVLLEGVEWRDAYCELFRLTPGLDLTYKIFDLESQTLALIIEHDIGPASRFNLQFNYCARGLGFVNVVLPEGWEARQIAFPVQGAPDLQVHCLSALDTAASKLAAGRVKDYRFVSAMIHYGLINAIDLHAHVPLLPVPQEQKDTLLAWAHEQCGQAGVVS